MNNPTIIVDIGSSTMKAGFSNDEEPALFVESLVGKETLPNVTGYVEKKTIGSAARKNLTLKQKIPIQRGEIIDIDSTVDLFEYIYDNLPAKVEPKDSSLVICQSPLNTKPKTEKFVTTMFEKFSIKNLYIGDHGKFVANALEKDYALVLQCGHGLTESIPVCAGYCVPNATRQMKFGGLDIDEKLMQLLIENGQSFITQSDVENVQQMKEKYCQVLPDNRRLRLSDSEIIKTTYKSSNGNDYWIGDERYIAAETIFDSRNVCHQAIQQIVVDSINHCDETIQKDVVKNVIISGGTSLLSGFAERLQKELSPYRNDINIISVPNRLYLSYIGASKYSLSDFIQQLWLTKEEFDESGPSIIHKKFL